MPDLFKNWTQSWMNLLEVRMVWYWPHIFSLLVCKVLELELKALLSSVVMAYANSSTFSLWSSFSIHESKRSADSLEASASGEGILKSSSSTVSLTAFLSSWKDADIQKKYVQCLLAHNFVTYEFIFTGCPPKYTFSIQCLSCWSRKQTYRIQQPLPS